ncbi:TlpA family protein disulfide reductase [Natrialbaceae archaeon A-arb3/5]
MRRREIVAGVTSIGILGGAGIAFRRGLPSIGDDRADAAEDDDGGSTDRLALETIDARGSEAGTLPVPTDGVTLIMFFAPSCGQCQQLMPRLADAQARLDDEYGDAVTVVSVAPQQSEDELREWWIDHEGDWTLGFDPAGTLAGTYRVIGYPVLIAIDSDGEKRWEDDGVMEAEWIVRNVEHVLEEYEEPDEGPDSTSGDGEDENASETRDGTDDPGAG